MQHGYRLHVQIKIYPRTQSTHSLVIDRWKYYISLQRPHHNLPQLLQKALQNRFITDFSIHAQRPWNIKRRQFVSQLNKDPCMARSPFSPSNKSISGCKIPSAAAWTSDLEMAWPWPPPLTSNRSFPMAITETSTRRLKLKISRVHSVRLACRDQEVSTSNTTTSIAITSNAITSNTITE